MKEINEEVIRSKVSLLMKEMGISKKKLGEILGSRGDHVNVRINRANRFLSGKKKKITLQEINKIATFFQKTVSWFLSPDQDFSDKISSTEGVLREDVFLTIEQSLRKFGFRDAYIGVQMEQIRAMDFFLRSSSKEEDVVKM